MVTLLSVQLIWVCFLNDTIDNFLVMRRGWARLPHSLEILMALTHALAVRLIPLKHWEVSHVCQIEQGDRNSRWIESGLSVLSGSLRFLRLDSLPLASFCDTWQNFLEFDLNHVDRVPTFGNAWLNLLFSLLELRIILCHVHLGQLVAELLLSLHDRLELNEYASRHVEKVVLGIKLLLVIPETSAPLT